MNIGDLQKLIGAIQLENEGNVKEIRISPFDFYDTTLEIISSFKDLGITLLPDVDVPQGMARVKHKGVK